MIKKIITTILSGLFLLTALSMFSLATAQEQERYPYDDNESYAYLVELEESRKDDVEYYYRWYIRVRQKETIKMLSYDKLEISFGGIDSYFYDYEPKVDTIELATSYYSTTDAPDTPILRTREQELEHANTVAFELTSTNLSWSDYIAEIRSYYLEKDERTIEFNTEESNAMGYKTLIVNDTQETSRADGFLYIIAYKTVYIYMDDATMPNSTPVVKIMSDGYVKGTYSHSLSNNPYDKFKELSQQALEKNSKLFRDEALKHLDAEMAEIDKALNGIISIKPKITRTINMQVPYKGSLDKGDGQKANDDDSKGNNKDVIINTDAEKSAGETGFSVAAAVILGVAAGAAGLFGAGAAGGVAGGTAADSTGEGENSKEGSTYQMIIGKDFGDSIKLGKKQRVWARMVEMKNGALIDRPDLTADISIFSNEVIIGALSQRGQNTEAEVQILENAPPEGIISFVYSGANGSFTNKVKFKLLGKGEIKLETDKVNILSTEHKPFELVYELINFIEEEPPLEITASSGTVNLDMGKNDKQQTVILISPGPDAEPWDHKAFIKPCTCEITAKDGELIVKTKFEVSVCFEGIGTAYEKVDIDTLPDNSLIECFSEKEKQKREEKALFIPLTVMEWDEKNRALEPNETKSSALRFTFGVHPDFEFKSPESKALAQRVIIKADLDTQTLPPPAALSIDKLKKPAAWRLMAAADPNEGAAPFDIQITVSCESDTSLTPLLLKAELKANPDFKGMVRWFLEYPIGSAAAEFIKLGNVDIYHKALDFIESRVYPLSGIPWSANLLWKKDDNSHYETGRGDIMRKSYIAIKDSHFPKGIGENEFKQVQTLVHELCHVIEDQHGDYAVTATSERHAYFLQHLSDLTRGLVGVENLSGDVQTDIRTAINAAYWNCMDPEIIGDLNNIEPWFGGKFNLSAHELFDKYAYHIDTLGGKMNSSHREVVAKAFRHWYFPGNLSEVEVQRGVKVDTIGKFVETDGLFKGAEWTFRWNQGMLNEVSLDYDGHTCETKDYEWTGGGELKLRVNMMIMENQSATNSHDSLLVTLDGGTYNMAARSFPSVRSFSTNWKSQNDHQHSLIFKKTGFNEFSSWTERKK